MPIGTWSRVSLTGMSMMRLSDRSIRRPACSRGSRGSRRQTPSLGTVRRNRGDERRANEHRTHAGRTDARRRRAWTRSALGRVSGRIGGSRIVVGCMTRRGPLDAVDPQRGHCSDLRIRHSQDWPASRAPSRTPQTAQRRHGLSSSTIAWSSAFRSISRATDGVARAVPFRLAAPGPSG